MEEFQATDFQRLKNTFGVDWVVLTLPSAGMNCPYRNREVSVCRLD